MLPPAPKLSLTEVFAPAGLNVNGMGDRRRVGRAVALTFSTVSVTNGFVVLITDSAVNNVGSERLSGRLRLFGGVTNVSVCVTTGDVGKLSV